MNSPLKNTLFSLLVLLMSSNIVTAQLYINEFLASNATGITDESGANEDWIEIYNAGAAAVDLAGYYISDDAAEPLLWQIPADNASLTTVPAGGYLILWADKDTEEGPHHVDIKLGAGGEDIILTAPDGTTTIDQLTFGPQSDDVSYGRVTDGDPSFQFFSTPTPDAANQGGSSPPTYTVTINVKLASGNDDAEEASNGGMIMNSTDIEMVQDGGNTYTAGFRFDNILIPQGATVSNAYIQFYAEEVQVGSANLNIKAQYTDDAPSFQSSNSNITSRPATSASANWIPAPWPTIDEVGTAQQSADLATVVEEVLAHPNWAEGNAMVFMVSGSGTRTTYSYEKNSNRIPELFIEAEVPLPTDPIPQLYINEVAANATTLTDPSGKKEDWIEIYNPNATAIELGGLYLTDDFDNLDKWQIGPGISIPAGGYLLFFADGDPEEGPLHADFSLKGGGEEVALVQLLADGLTIIDSVSYEDMPFQATYGRQTDGANNWVFFGEITPEASNNGAGLYLPAPEFSVPSGSYSGTQSVTISTSLTGTNIYYTTDGALPDVNATPYNGSAISVSSTQSLRAIATKPGYANSQASDATYLINESHNVPIVYLTTDPDNFFDDEIGIYVDGTNGVVAYCATSPVNWAQDWERPVNMKMFLPTGELAFDVDAGVEISGACSRNLDMKSLAINLRNKEFGDDAIEYPLFPERDHENYQRLKIRNSGQDYYRLGFRDMLNQSMLFGKLDLDLQAGRPCLVYINGDFWGTYNIREKFAGEYFEELYGVDEDELDIIKSPGLAWRDIKKGTDATYNALFDVVAASNMNNNSDWDYFQSQVDVNEMMNYWIVMSYMANYDWPANNLTVWREQKPDAKWRYGVADTDGSTYNKLGSGADPDFDTFAEINDPNSSSWPNHSNSTLFLRKALERTEFRDEFIQRTCSVIELIYNNDRVTTFIDEMVGLYGPNVPDQLNRWGYDNAMGGNIFSWNRWVDLYRDFWIQRPDYFRNHIDNFYNLNGFYDLTISFDANSGGDVFVNTNEMEIPYNYIGTYFKNIPLQLKAVPKSGYQFVRWDETGDTNPVINFSSASNATLTPIFELLDCSQIPAGTPCNDGDDCTVNDEYDANCNCAGTFADADNDGVCDADDQCPGFDDNIDLNNNGIPDGCDVNCTDNDNDQVCEVDDCDDNNPNVPAPPGTVCDDGNAQTTGDVIQADGCTCQGTITPPNGSYCDSKGNAPWLEWIANVQLNDLDSPSGKSKYSDFTNLFASLSKGANYTLTLTAGYSWTSYDEYFRVWIDYNRDNVFDESSELAFSGILTGVANGAGNGDVSGTINVPGNALTGTTRMRVSMQRDAYAGPCDDFATGEVEDYSVVISGGNVPTLTLSNCPANIEQTATIGQMDVVVSWTAPTATTTCDPATVSLTQTAGPASGSAFSVGTTTTISYTATDQCGNQEICSFTVAINAPSSGSISLTCPTNITVAAAAGQTGATVSWAAATASTTCGSGGLNVTQSSGAASGSFFQIGSYQISYTATDACSNQESCTFTITVLGGSTNYCASKGNRPWHDWIGGVELNTLNNASGKARYSDFTGMSTSLTAGTTYPVNLTAAYSYTTYDEYFKVWIDYNQNGVFEEPAEVALNSIQLAPPNGSGSAVLSDQIAIPATAALGNTRMRVAMKRGSEPGPCEEFEFGEVEDYTVSISSNFNIGTPNAYQQITPEVLLYPNPATSEVTLQLEEGMQLAELEVFTISTQSVLRMDAAEGVRFYQFDVQKWPEGMYYVQLKLQDGSRLAKRFIVSGLAPSKR